MRLIVFLSLACTLAGFGCGTPVPGPALPVLTVEEQEVEAARVFEVAQKLETERRPQGAVAAYRHILRDFPKTPHGKKASDRIKILQHGRPIRVHP
jgi:hypothetical protein